MDQSNMARRPVNRSESAKVPIEIARVLAGQEWFNSVKGGTMPGYKLYGVPTSQISDALWHWYLRVKDGEQLPKAARRVLPEGLTQIALQEVLDSMASVQDRDRRKELLLWWSRLPTIARLSDDKAWQGLIHNFNLSWEHIGGDDLGENLPRTRGLRRVARRSIRPSQQVPPET